MLKTLIVLSEFRKEKFSISIEASLEVWYLLNKFSRNL